MSTADPEYEISATQAAAALAGVTAGQVRALLAALAGASLVTEHYRGTAAASGHADTAVSLALYLAFFLDWRHHFDEAITACQQAAALFPLRRARRPVQRRLGAGQPRPRPGWSF